MLGDMTNLVSLPLPAIPRQGVRKLFDCRCCLYLAAPCSQQRHVVQLHCCHTYAYYKHDIIQLCQLSLNLRQSLQAS